jgi:hypothetical protein
LPGRLAARKVLPVTQQTDSTPAAASRFQRVSVALTHEQHARLVAMAAEMGLSLSSLVRVVMYDYLLSKGARQ